MLLSLEPRGQQSRAMLWLSPLLAAVLTLCSGALLFALLGKLSDLLLVQLSRPFLHWQDSHSLQPA